MTRLLFLFSCGVVAACGSTPVVGSTTQKPNHAANLGTTSASAPGASSGSSSGSASSNAATVVSPGHESWVWMYGNWKNSLDAVSAHPSSFTHVSPTFYTLNYDYVSGVADYTTCDNGGLGGYLCAANGANDFDHLTTKQITAQLTALGLRTVPAIYGGSANGGSDDGIVNLLDNTSGAADHFIAAMTQEAVNNRYAGYNIDWEVSPTIIGGAYAEKFVTFADHFKAALAAHEMFLSVDVISSNINGTWCSDNNGFIDFAKLSRSSVDRIIIEDYSGSLGVPATACPAIRLDAIEPIGCPINDSGSDVTVVGMFNFMCANLPADKIVIGLESNSGATNPIAGEVFGAMQAYGFNKVAVWPQAEANAFMSSQGYVPATGNWYAQLSAFLQ